MERLELRVEKLEEDMSEACKDIKLILTNHLPHIQEELVELRTTIKWWTWIWGVVLGAILAGVIKLIIAI